MLIIAIDTSGANGSIALCDENGCREERSLQLGRQHGQTLIPALGQLLTDHGLRPHDCELLAVSIGPGSFTGLRVGIVCAKSWSYATGCSVAAIDSLTAIAANAPDEVAAVQVVCDAQRSDVFVGSYVRDSHNEWQRPNPIEIISAEQWMARLKPDDFVTGPGLEKYGDQARPCCQLLEPTGWDPRAARIGQLGLKSLNAGVLADPWALEPLYLRRSSAEDKWDARLKSRETNVGS